MKITLGHRYRDRISGWEGVATARYEYLNGCVRVSLDAHDKDGEPKGHVFDVEQLAPVDSAPVLTDHAPSGGPRDSTPVRYR